MKMTQILQAGDSQALLIPNEMKTEKERYYINKIGDVFVAVPVDDPWAAARQAINLFSEDFMEDRGQPSQKEPTKREEI